ncbi:MAG TPA: DUF3567 domain-containing protein [Burkholderiaceae bacterium]|nr:DUF3567 domain-containing protein [Burkholderiaceae bacterium]
MQMLYNSENFAVVHIEVAEAASSPAWAHYGVEAPRRGGYEIVDKQSRREIFIEGTLAEYFKAGVEALIQQSPSAEEIDDYLSAYTVLAQQPVLLH